MRMKYNFEKENEEWVRAPERDVREKSKKWRKTHPLLRDSVLNRADWNSYGIYLCVQKACVVFVLNPICLSMLFFFFLVRFSLCVFFASHSLVRFIFYTYDAVLLRKQTRNLYRDDNFARAIPKQTAIISSNIFCSFFCFFLLYFFFGPKIINGCHFSFCLVAISVFVTQK